MNLIEGSAAVISSPDGRFSPYTVHYAETFILPMQAGEYQIAPLSEGDAALSSAPRFADRRSFRFILSNPEVLL